MRLYELRDDNNKILSWGKSRFDDGTDNELAEAVYAEWALGSSLRCCVCFEPPPHKQRTPEQMRAQRIRNMKERIAAKAPLFADQLEAEEMEREYFSLERCQADHQERAEYLAQATVDFWNNRPADREVTIQEGV